MPRGSQKPEWERFMRSGGNLERYIATHYDPKRYTWREHLKVRVFEPGKPEWEGIAAGADSEVIPNYQSGPLTAPENTVITHIYVRRDWDPTVLQRQPSDVIRPEAEPVPTAWVKAIDWIEV